ncbi:HD domain-containing protein (plasmid) [Aneurinibacillus sp. Ricciae_BoGa-3]|uniref:YfbR-like 5'-deoxynucleotidase n=1 Tax=Aneurinibacillus sp. Ricciae_BoGa-3 TaxID=3022697 RepID=UPI002340A0C2|nr:YfbR-like 5'-deoxynucleotidase [Aneurinibacillus sp. Ricciae_BoGa-3]WCK57632.1 HD domain-containing protein [Aneurinibacillus sp. Ricciae_BoGa-3]
MSFGTYMYKIRGLMHLKRYQNLFKFKQRSVAEHSWSVAKIAQGLAKIETQYGNNVNMGLLLERCISHDEVELFTGDILSKTKRITEAMKKAVDEAEIIVFNEKFTKIIPQEWIEEYRQYILYAKDGTLEGEILRAADIIDTIFESVEEIKLGNQEDFGEILVSVTESLITIDLASVKYFLKENLGELGLDIREYYGENVYRFIESIKDEKSLIS